MKRSLVWQVSGAILVAFAASFFLVVEGGQRVFNQGFHEALGVRRDQATFIRDEVARYGPSEANLARLGRAFHARLTYQPWAPPIASAALAREPLVLQPGRVTGPRAGWNAHYRARIDRVGQPVGVLDIQFQAWRRFRGPNSWLPWIHMAVLGGLVLLPLWLWVLRPLRGMIAIAHRLGEGDLLTPVPLAHVDEFGDLEQAFEGLRVRLSTMISQKERLLRDISHELRSPLSRMAIALSLARTRPEAAEYLDAIQDEMLELSGMIEELLAAARVRGTAEEPIEEVDASALVADLLRDRTLAFQEAGLTVRSELSPVLLRGRRRPLARAVGNVLDNALKYSSSGQTVDVRLVRTGQEAVVSVANPDPGLSNEDLPHLFEAFYRPDLSRSRGSGGTGLGLAIVKTIVEDHGGEVRFERVADGRVQVTLSLPAPTASPA